MKIVQWLKQLIYPIPQQSISKVARDRASEIDTQMERFEIAIRELRKALNSD